MCLMISLKVHHPSRSSHHPLQKKRNAARDICCTIQFSASDCAEVKAETEAGKEDPQLSAAGTLLFRSIIIQNTHRLMGPYGNHIGHAKSPNAAIILPFMFSEAWER